MPVLLRVRLPEASPNGAASGAARRAAVFCRAQAWPPSPAVRVWPRAIVSKVLLLQLRPAAAAAWPSWLLRRRVHGRPGARRRPPLGP